jgi:hypothetical protein
MIVIHHHHVVITSEAFSIIGKKVVSGASGETASMHEDHDGAFMRTVDLRCPKIHSQAVFAWHCGGGSPMEQKGILVGIREVLSVHIEVCGILLWANSTVCKRVANPGPWLRFGCWHKAPRARGRSAIWYAFENVDSISLKSTDFARAGLYHSSQVGTNDIASRTWNDDGLGLERGLL